MYNEKKTFLSLFLYLKKKLENLSDIVKWLQFQFNLYWFCSLIKNGQSAANSVKRKTGLEKKNVLFCQKSDSVK